MLSKAMSDEAADDRRRFKALAHNAAKAKLKAEIARLSDAEKAQVLVQSFLAPRWVVFDWFIAGKTQKEAQIIVRAVVNRETKDVLVEVRPAPASVSGKRLTLNAVTILAPLSIAFCLGLAGALLHIWTGNSLVGVAVSAWLICQALTLAIVHAAASNTAAIKLPDGRFLIVNRMSLEDIRARDSRDKP